MKKINMCLRILIREINKNEINFLSIYIIGLFYYIIGLKKRIVIFFEAYGSGWAVAVKYFNIIRQCK